MDLRSYLPEDRVRSLATGDPLPRCTSGTVLIADIAGFTAFTEALHRSLGAQRGADEVTCHLDAVYGALILEVERQRGVVIGFAGDAITCWFDDSEGAAADRAVSCAVGMQRAMQSFLSAERTSRTIPPIALKVAIASGPAFRFIVGAAALQVFDVLAGPAVRRAAAGEKLARRGEVLLDAATVAALRDTAAVEWGGTDGDDRFAVLKQLHVEMLPAERLDVPVVAEDLLRHWLHPLVLERERGVLGLSAAYRPCVALFVGFTEIDNEPQQNVNAFVQLLQNIADRHAGTPMALTLDEVGGCAHVTFGAVVAHEDDARRAVTLALELRSARRPWPGNAGFRIGIAQGKVRVGSFGGPTRRAFGVLGDDVNLAARLMQTAAPGEILVSAQVQRVTSDHFSVEARPPVRIKGKGIPLPVFAVLGERRLRAIRLQEPAYALPMVGRESQLNAIGHLLDSSRAGHVQVVGIAGEAGMGKSRLVAEAIRAARQRGFTGYGGACRSDRLTAPYHPWKAVWSAMFNVDAEQPLRRQVAALRAELEDRVPQRVEALPLLGQLLDLDLPDNAFTRTLEPRLRQSTLHALLEDALVAFACEGPLLIVLEDVHWTDTVSLDLLEHLVRAVAHRPVCFVLTFRPTVADSQMRRLVALPTFSRVDLTDLTRSECLQAIRAKLVQQYPARDASVSDELVDRLRARAQGNPFFLEELLNYLHDRGLDVRDTFALASIELPDSLHALVLSRIDQLGRREQVTLRVASIVGRRFRARWLAGYCPEVGEPPQLKEVLDTLHSLDITPLDSLEPEPIHLFKHIVVHEVTYESLPFAARARLHERLARYLETTYADNLPVELLAYHYGRGDDRGKRCEYLRKAGEAAQKVFANDSALAYYAELLPLLDGDPAQQATVRLQRGAVLELIGRNAEADEDDRAALSLALSSGDAALAARAQLALGRLCRLRGEYESALAWFVKAGSSLPSQRAQIALETGFVHSRMGDFSRARASYSEGLTAARATGDRAVIATALNHLGVLAENQGDNATAEQLHQEALDTRREIGDTWGISWSLNNLGNVAIDLGRHAEARTLFEESLALKRAMGDKAGVGSVLNNLGTVALVQGDLTSARTLFEQALSLMREVGDRFVVASLLGNLGKVLTDQGDADAARSLYDESVALSREIGDKWGIAASLCSLGLGALAAGDDVSARRYLIECLPICREMEERSLTISALNGLALLHLREQEAVTSDQAAPLIAEALTLAQAMRAPIPLTSSLIAAALLAVRRGDALGAARLLGAVDAALASIEAPAEAEVQSFHRLARAEARAALAEGAFETAWRAGAQWSLEDAASTALHALPADPAKRSE